MRHRPKSPQEHRRCRPIRQATSRSEIVTLHIHPSIKSELETAAMHVGVSISTIAAQLLTETVKARLTPLDHPQPYRPD